jgi:hypothetical protein
MVVGCQSVRYKKKDMSYHDAINAWRASQRDDVIFLFVQFINVSIGNAPRAYIATPNEVAAHLKMQCHGRGYGALQEDYQRDHPGSKYDRKIPKEWAFTRERIDSID